MNRAVRSIVGWSVQEGERKIKREGERRYKAADRQTDKKKQIGKEKVEKNYEY